MGDVAKGIKSFKKGISDEDEQDTASSTSTTPGATTAKTVDHKADETK